ncbi:MAG: hypothetical protein CM1200mP6_06080 [Anaerolineaceae bacterium]|nr:MAG: hypothetical protein CM1200mP6_06080 [Anaerolineaceae bacterium]
MSLEGSHETQELDDDIVSAEIDDDLSGEYISNVVTTERVVLQDEDRQRQELHSAGYEYAFTASAEDIKRIYEYTVNGRMTLQLMLL